jgi:hypothetical protein
VKPPNDLIPQLRETRRTGGNDCNRDAPAGEQLAHVPPGTLGVRPSAPSDGAEFLSRSPQSAQVAAAHG